MRRTKLSVMSGRFLLIALLAAMLLVLAGCGARLGPATTTEAPADALVVDIPTIYIDFDADGNATLGGIPVAQLGDALGQDLSSISLDADTIAKLQRLNIQHVQIATRPNGALIFINGKPAPALVWNDAALAALVSTLDAMGQDLGAAGGILPLLPQLGLNIGLRFPVADGKSAIPLTVPDAPFDAVAKADLDAIVAQQPTLPLEINYAPDGSFELAGIPPLMAGMIQGPLAAAKLTPDNLTSIQELGLESVGIRTAPGGLLVSINGQPLPFLQFTQLTELFSLIDLAGAFGSGDSGMLDSLKGPLEQALPLLQQFGIGMTVNFPGQ
ncbi:MAG: hypothetical protein KDE20_23545 [Caldilineaceae bacterium]|nr:hypothetical protein [Caldilineaceae bacterium]